MAPGWRARWLSGWCRRECGGKRRSSTLPRSANRPGSVAPAVAAPAATRVAKEAKGLKTAVFAGGCFWCLDAVYRQMQGIINVESGYSNGAIKNPTYKEVCSGRTGHAEVTKIYFNPTITSYQQILEVFWRIHNPTTLNRQGNDIGTQYRSGIYFMNEEQERIAKASKQAVEESGLWAADGKVVTEILPLDNYWPAEDYHQDYFANNPENQYCVYVVSEKVEKFKKAFAELLKTAK